MCWDKMKLRKLIFYFFVLFSSSYFILPVTVFSDIAIKNGRIKIDRIMAFS